MGNVYLIIGNCSDGYDDISIWHVCAFSDRAQGEARIKKLRFWLKKNRINELEHDANVPNNPFDPEFKNQFVGGDFGLGYSLVEVPSEWQ